MNARSDGAKASASLRGVIAVWEARVRRALLVAHAAPAVFGLVAVSAGVGSGETRPIDVVAWAVVLCWSLFLLISGWGRAAAGLRLGRWIMADSLVMAALMFIGTPARQVVHYVAIDGALFSAAFLSTGLGLAQLAVVFSGLGVAALARELGSTAPTPLVGWLLPAVVPTLGVLAFGYFRRGLGRLEATIAETEQLMVEERRLSAATARREAVVEGLQSVDVSVAPAVQRMRALVDRYAVEAGSDTLVQEEVQWLQGAIRRAEDDLRSLRDPKEVDEPSTLEEAVDSGLLKASAIHIHALIVQKNVTDSPELIPAGVSNAITGYVCEAVTNAITHGEPPVSITATWYPPRGVEVVVGDAGKGFLLEDSGERSLGVVALEHYAHDVGARLVQRNGAGGHALIMRIDEVPLP